ncbi:MAG TPA: SAM-dependent methyltransferase [Polyangia bacterium]|nr:SAM-dependent methyltransferase [Polyangia bacterium]
MSDDRGGRVGRGGLKLEAAITRFHLQPRIRGGRALDIGASTGGFTEALLAHGATHVTAVDVGKGQLHPSLVADERVTNLDGVHWKTLPLSEAAGPFDFFTVDVSFIAARSMLRGLAFRLRPGAEGVVLVKPQFEVEDKRVKGGDVSDPNLRRDALQSVQEKAESLGFVLVSSADSPVAGSSGTIEILAHLRFAGRSEKLPQPGESRGQKEPKKPKKRKRGDKEGVRAVSTTLDALDLFAVGAPGLEAILAREVSALVGVRNVKAVPGGVEFAGDLDVLYRANLWLRTATRVLVRVGQLEAREFAKMRHRTASLPWERFIAPGAKVAIAASQSGSRLYHTGAIAENLEAALGDRLGAPLTVDAEGVKVLARGVADQWTLSIDSSGDLLHRRGWRQELAHAPLRETLAAALLLLCDWDPTTPFVDPMCGAGTLPLEACALAMRMAPGLHRDFAFTRWPIHDENRWAAARAAAAAAQLPAPPAPIIGGDRSPAALSAAERNAERSGMKAHVQLVRAELGDVKPPTARGLVLMNPPYGRRIGDPRLLRKLYADIGRVLRTRFAGWHAGLLVADRRLIDAIGAKVRHEHSLFNGGLRVTLVHLDLGGGGSTMPG